MTQDTPSKPTPEKIALIASTFTNSLKIARKAGLSKNEAILKANALTAEALEVDVFNLLKMDPPKIVLDPNSYTEEIKVFYETLDLLLASGEVLDHGDKVDVIWIHMPTARKSIEAHLGRSFNPSTLFPQLKISDRYIEQKNNKRSCIFKKQVRAWAFKRVPPSDRTDTQTKEGKPS